MLTPEKPDPVSPYRETTPDHVARAGCGAIVGLFVAMSAVSYFMVRDPVILLSIVLGFGAVAWFTRDWFWRHVLTIIRLLY